MLKLNCFYKCKDHYLLIFPTKEKIASVSGPLLDRDHIWALYYSVYCSKVANCKVDYSERDSLFLVLESCFLYGRVLFKDKVGRIAYDQYINYTELAC